MPRRHNKEAKLSDKFPRFRQICRMTPVVLATALNAWASEPIVLNSERIQQQFGSYGVDVLTSEPGLRRSSLYSVAEDDRICRTYAIVRFAGEMDDSYSHEHTKVLEGNSLGNVFKTNGWGIRKQTLHIGSISINATDGQIFDLMRLVAERSLALHVYQLLLTKNEQIFEYATILEVHHPDYLIESELLEIYPYDDTNSLSRDTLAQLEALIITLEIRP